jgi:hypothetical protein
LYQIGRLQVLRGSALPSPGRDVAVKRDRPAAVVVLALSGVLVGGLGLLGAAGVVVVCFGLSVSTAAGFVVPLSPAGAEQLRTALPGFRAFEALLPLTALLLAALVLATGFGLLTGRRPARRAALLTAGAVLVVGLAASLYEVVVVVPGIDNWHSAASVRRGGHDAPPATDPEIYWVALLLVVGGLIFALHAVATLVVLTSPAVAEAFGRGLGGRADAEG